MDATGIASGAGAVVFGGAALRYVWRKLDADWQARARARQRAQWEQHATCLRLRTAGECVGLPGEASRLGPGLVGPVAVEPAPMEVVPDYVPDALVGEVIRDLLDGRDVS
jgi:hypothetical protein